MTLRLRLALWYGALTAAVVALACTYSYAVHSRTHYDELDRGLIATAGHVKQELAEARSLPDTERVLGASLALGAGIRVFDQDGRLVGQSATAATTPALAPGAPALLLDTGRPYPAVGSLAPELHHAAHMDGRFAILGTRPHRWRAVFLPVAAGGMRVAATIPLEPIDRAVAGFGLLMAAIALAGALLAFAIGWLVAGRALRPVATLQETAAAIERDQQFARRVPGGGSDELGRLASTFNAMLASLEHAYAAQQRFVSDASHELRAPLTVIQANLELLRSPRDLSPEDWQASLRESHMEAVRLTRLVSDLLVLARADAGAPLRQRPVALDDLVLQTVGDAEHLARGQALRIASIAPITLVADPDRVKQLLLILLDNALKYSGPERPVVVRVCRDHAMAVVEVEDAGIGIAPADLEHVFERFFRADPARSRDPGGTGLGLPIARWIAQQHGGDLQLASVPGRGTIATVRLPL
ncbi:MAG: sensor histidine kinase [Gemmatimonadaceae bacterium]